MSLREYGTSCSAQGCSTFRIPSPRGRPSARKQEKVVKYLNKVSEVRFRTPQGTDLTVGVKGRKWINCDGHVNFPDGEVFTGPLEDATEASSVTASLRCTRAAEVDGIRLRFKGGRVVDASATKG